MVYQQLTRTLFNEKDSVYQPFLVWAAPTCKFDKKSLFLKINQIFTLKFFFDALDECLRALVFHSVFHSAMVPKQWLGTTRV